MAGLWPQGRQLEGLRDVGQATTGWPHAARMMRRVVEQQWWAQRRWEIYDRIAKHLLQPPTYLSAAEHVAASPILIEYMQYHQFIVCRDD